MQELKKEFLYSLTGINSLVSRVEELVLAGAVIDHGQTYRVGSGQYVLSYTESAVKAVESLEPVSKPLVVEKQVEQVELSDDEDGPFEGQENPEDEDSFVDEQSGVDVFDFSNSKPLEDNSAKLKELAALTKKVDMISFAEKYGLELSDDLIQPSAMKKSMQRQLGLV